MSVFPEEINILIGELSKKDYSSQCGWASFSPLRTWIEQKGEKRQNFLSWAFELGHQSPALGLRLTPSALQFAGLQTWNKTCTISFPKDLRPLDLSWNYTISFPRSPSCRQPMMGLLNLPSMCMVSYWFCFSGEPLVHLLIQKFWSNLILESPPGDFDTSFENYCPIGLRTFAPVLENSEPQSDECIYRGPKCSLNEIILLFIYIN